MDRNILILQVLEMDRILVNPSPATKKKMHLEILSTEYVCCILFVWFDSLRPLNNLSVMREGSSWVEPVLS